MIVRRHRRLPLAGLAFAALLLVAAFAGCGSSSSSGADQFRGQTDSPLLEFGEESSEAAREEGADAVSAFFDARAKGDWAGACVELSREVLEKIEHLATSTTDLEDTSCPSFLGSFTRLSPRERRESTIVDAGAMREQGQRAFLIYHGGREVVYAMPLRREGDRWKVDALTPKQLS